MVRFFLGTLFLFCLAPNLAFCQYSETIQSSRPGASNVPFTTGKGMAQFQSGILYSHLKNSEIQSTLNGANFGIVGRYGFLEKWEIRSTVVLSYDQVNINSQSQEFYGLSYWNMGFRVNILNGKGSAPSLGFESDLRFANIGAQEYQINSPAPRAFLLFTAPLISNISITSNLGIVWETLDEDPFASFTLNLSTPLSNKTSVFVEAFGDVFLNFDGFNLDGGIGHLINDNLQLDMSLALLGVAGDTQGWWIDAGVSWRFNVNRKN